MNALKSGLHAESHIVRGEDPEALAQLAAEYHAEFHPVTPRQRDLVDTIVHNQWLIRRLRLTEADLHAKHFQSRDDDFEEKWRYKVVRREHPLADAFESLEKRLLRLQSRLNSLERSNRAALKELRDLQAIETEPPSDPIGFVPSTAVEQASTLAMPAFEPACSAQTPPPAPIGFVPSILPPGSQTPDPRPQTP